MGFESPFLHMGLMVKWCSRLQGLAETWLRSLIWTLVDFAAVCVWLGRCWGRVGCEEKEEEVEEEEEEKEEENLEPLSTSWDCWSKKM